MKKTIYIFALLLLAAQASAQQLSPENKVQVDSLKQVIHSSVNDSLKLQSLNDVAQIYLDKFMFDSSLVYINKALEFAEQKNKPVGKATALSKKGIYFYYQGKNSEALEVMQEALTIMVEEGYIKGVASLSNNLGVLHETFGNNEQALELYLQSIRYREEILKDQTTLTPEQIKKEKQGMAASSVNIGNIQENFGYYDNAVAYYNQAFGFYQELSDTAGVALVYSNIGLIHEFRREYAKALSYYQTCLDLNKEINNKRGLATAYNNIGNIYYQQYNYDKAMLNYTKCFELAKEVNDYPRMIESGINQGNIYQDRGQFELSIEKLEEALQLSQQLGEAQNMSFCLNNIGTIYQQAEMFEEAVESYQLSLEISEQIGDVKGTVMTRVNIATSKDYLAQTEESHQMYLQALQDAKKIGAFQETEFALRAIYFNFLRTRPLSEAYKYLVELIELREFDLENNYFTLSENEKNNYIEKLEQDLQLYYDFADEYHKDFEGSVAKCYELSLKAKGLSLRSTRNLRLSIQQSKNKELLQQYDDWIALKKTINSKFNIGENPGELITQAEEMEKKLIQSSNSFKDYRSKLNLNWESVESKLDKNEAVVEIVRFMKRTQAKNEYYYGAIVLKTDEEPAWVRLCSEDSLKALFEGFSGNNLQFVNQLYGTRENPDLRLYNLLWRPLEPVIQQKNDIILATTGLIHKIAFSALVDENKNYVIDRYNIRQVNSTDQILERNKDGESLPENALLLGGVNYNSDTSSSEVWEYLEGSLKEVELLNELFTQEGITTSLFTENEATESQLKETIGKAGIIHIATHGFFFPDPKKLREEELKSSSYNEDIEFRGKFMLSSVEKSQYANFAFLSNVNPLARSGIAVAKANDVWQRSPFQEGEDGVLTAQEVALMNLPEAKLVVLSACETGLGDIIGAEGVFGLQRAFKLAGAQKLILSLWKVPDKETAEFMNTFYQKLMELKSINKAFHWTQKEMKSKYAPYYWAAFTLIE